MMKYLVAMIHFTELRNECTVLSKGQSRDDSHITGLILK